MYRGVVGINFPADPVPMCVPTPAGGFSDTWPHLQSVSDVSVPAKRGTLLSESREDDADPLTEPNEPFLLEN